MPNLKYLNINGVNYSLGRDTRIHYGSTSETITDLQEGDLLIDLVEIPPAGKNLLPPYSTSGGTSTSNGITFTYNSNGSITASGTATANALTGSLSGFRLPAGTYKKNAYDSTNKVGLLVQKKVTSSNWVTIGLTTSDTFTLTEEDAQYELAVRMRVESGATLNSYSYIPIIRLPDTTDASELYNGNTYTVSLSSAGTVYGGTLDVVSGQLTVTRILRQAVASELDSSHWAKGGATNFDEFYMKNTADTYGKTGENYGAENVICSHAPSLSSASTTQMFTRLANREARIVFPLSMGINSLDAFYAWNQTQIDNNNPLQFCYVLQTAVTYQLTPTQVVLLRGDSKIWSDSGDTSVIYTNINDITSTASGSIANITSAKKALAQSVVTEINCKQDLNGYDHPWAGGAGKNMVPDTSLQATVTRTGITATSSNGVVSFSGTSTSSGAEALMIGTSGETILLKAGVTYYFSANWSDGHTPSTSTLRMDLRVYNGASPIYAYETDVSGGTYTPTEDTYVRLGVRIPANYAVPRGLKAYPIITTDSDTTYEPYSNICPITGYNNINITKINPLYDTSETGTRMYKYNEDATWTEISVSGNGGLLNLENGSATGSVRGVNTSSEDGTYVMGQNAVAVGGSTQAAGANSFTSGLGTVAQRGSQAVFGEYNTLDTTGSTSTRGDYIFMLGNGTSNARSNATTIDWEGSIDTHGAITAGSIDNGYGLNDQALLASDTIALWEDIING